MRIAIALWALATFADGPGRIVAKYTAQDFDLTADPNAPQWRGIGGVFAENGPMGQPTPGHRTEIRARWSDKYLYILFINPYQELFLKPSPSTTTETNRLWEWDVAEVFVGADFDRPRHYREYQVSPQGEWVDLDIDRDRPQPEGGWTWNSGFTVKAVVDAKSKIWYGEMKIPIASINGAAQPGSAQQGKEMRINFYRIQGPKDSAKTPPRAMIAWQPTGANNYHVPEAFGRIVLAK